MDTQILQSAIKTLRNGSIVAHATETCYGLACDLTNPDAVAKLFTLKKRPDHMPVSALFASVEQAKQYVEWNNKAQQLADEHLPGPLTLILNQCNQLLHPTPQQATRSDQPITIGVRISPHPTALALVTAFGSPISTTSANIHGQPNTYSIDEILAQGLEPDFVIDDGPIAEVPASRIIDVSGGKEKILR